MSVSVKDVAARAGVSVGTVSNYLNRPEKVSEVTAERVRDAIDVLGFVRNDAARQLRAGRSRAIGLIVLDLENPFFAGVARGAENEAAAAGFSVIVGNSDHRVEQESAYIDLFEQQRVHGVLISPVAEASRRLEAVRRRGIPAVLVDRTSADHSFSSVAMDDVTGGRVAVEHLLGGGHRSVAFVGGPRGLRQIEERWAGADQAVAACPGAALEIVDISMLSIEQGRRAGRQMVARPVAERPDAVFAANDLIAIGLLQSLAAGGIAVPDDMALIGYDDIVFAGAAVVPLSSIRQPAEQLGASAVRTLLAEAENPDAPARHVMFQPELVARRSTASTR